MWHFNQIREGIFLMKDSRMTETILQWPKNKLCGLRDILKRCLSQKVTVLFITTIKGFSHLAQSCPVPVVTPGTFHMITRA